MSEYREDTVRIPKSAKWTPQGFLSIKDARIARIGVQNYVKDGKLVRELRLPEEVIKSVESFRNALITLNHPSELVTADNSEKYNKGFVPDCNYAQDGWIHSDFHITNKDAVEAAIATHRQLSCGYTCDLEQSSGVWKDELGVMGEKNKEYEYDCIQRNILGNHVALVERARAGDNARFDSDETDVIIRIDSVSKSKKSMITKTIVIPDSESKSQVEIKLKLDESDESIPVLDRLQSQLNKEYNLAIAAKSEHDSLKPKYDSLEGEKVALESKVKQLESDIEAAKNTRTDSTSTKSWLKTYEQVKNVFTTDSPDPFELDELGLKKAYLSPLYPDYKLDEKSSEFVESLFFHCQNSPKNHTQETKEHLDGLGSTEAKKDSGLSDVEKRSKNLIKFN